MRNCSTRKIQLYPCIVPGPCITTRGLNTAVHESVLMDRALRKEVSLARIRGLFREYAHTMQTKVTDHTI